MASMASAWRGYGLGAGAGVGAHPTSESTGPKGSFLLAADDMKRKRDRDVDDVDDVERPNSAASCNNDGNTDIIIQQ